MLPAARSRSLLVAVAGAALLTTAAPAAARPSATPRIAGGTPAAQGAYPAHVFVRQDQGLISALCGGTVIAKRFVVTAAHCVHSGGLIGGGGPVVDAKQMTVFAGSTTAGQGRQIPVVALAAHPSFPSGGSSFPDDVAVLALARDADVEPLPLTDPVADKGTYDPGVMAKVIGFGKSGANAPVSQALLESSVPIVSDADCQKTYGAALSPDVQICAGGDGVHDVCEGDSGGPLMTLASGVYKLTGVVSFGLGNGCATGGVPSVFADLTAADVRNFVVGTAGHPPTAQIPGGPGIAGVPLTLSATAADSDPGGAIASYVWDLDGNGSFEGPQTPTVKLSRATAGTTRVGLKVTDASGMVSVVQRDVAFGKAPRAAVSVSAKRRRDGRITVRGRVRGAGCAGGTVTVRARPAKGRAVSRRSAKLRKTCRYAVTVRAGRRARITARFDGTPALRVKSVTRKARV